MTKAGLYIIKDQFFKLICIKLKRKNLKPQPHKGINYLQVICFQFDLYSIIRKVFSTLNISFTTNIL